MMVYLRLLSPLLSLSASLHLPIKQTWAVSTSVHGETLTWNATGFRPWADSIKFDSKFDKQGAVLYMHITNYWFCPRNDWLDIQKTQQIYWLGNFYLQITDLDLKFNNLRGKKWRILDLEIPRLYPQMCGTTGADPGCPDPGDFRTVDQSDPERVGASADGAYGPRWLLYEAKWYFKWLRTWQHG